MFVVAYLTVAQAATIINAVHSVIQTTLGLAIVVILIYAMHDVNSAINWSIICRKLHSSLWPTLLRTDSASSIRTPFGVSFISTLGFVSSILVVVVGIITPLGLRDGPTLQTGYKLLAASYIPDTSPIGLTTSPRDKFTYGRICGAMSPVPCPGNGDNGNTTAIASSILDIFSSTSQGPFNTQFRRYYQGTGGYNYSMTNSEITVLESFVLRDDTFAIEGLVVDMSRAGVGLWNHTLPTLKGGGVWSQDMLWLEPVTSCVNTNLTVEYVLADNGFNHNQLSLVDRGGFVNLTTEYPTFSRNGQDIDIYAHAYKSAVLTNFGLMRSYNVTARNQSSIGKSFPINSTQATFSVGTMQYLRVDEFAIPTNISTADLQTLCQGYGGADNANITNVGVHCGLLLGTPERTDGGDARLPGDNSTWGQSLYACSSVARARIQTVRFSFNGSSDLSQLSISRQDNSTPVLWAVEKSDLTISDLQPFWGRVAESYADDASIATSRSDIFYVPAGSSDTWGVVSSGQPQSVLAAAWSMLYQIPGMASPGIPDYTGSSNVALLNKWQSMLQSDPTQGPAAITNRIWVDLVANNLVGTDAANNLLVAQNEPSISYDFRYGIPALLLIIIWLPLFIVAVFTLLTGKLTLTHIRHLLNQTSVGRIVVGDSALMMLNGPSTPAIVGHTSTSHLQTTHWSKTVGEALIAFRSFGITSRRSPGGPADQMQLLSGRDEAMISTQSLAYKEGGDCYLKGRPLGETLTEFEKSG